MGRKKRDLITVLRSQLWVNELCRLTNSVSNKTNERSFYELDKKFEIFQHNHSSDYNNGQSGVSETTRNLIDKEFVSQTGSPIKVSDFYLVGPIDDDGDHLPLWEALGGPIENLWQILFWYDPAIELQHELGLSFKTKTAVLIARLFNTINPSTDWLTKLKPNCVAQAYRNDDIQVDMHLLIALIAAWRLANFMNDSTHLFNYMMIGVLDKAAENLLKPLGIYGNFKQYLIELDAPKVQRFNEVISGFNASTQELPELIVDADGNEGYQFTKHEGFEHFKFSYEGTRVSEYLGILAEHSLMSVT